MLSFSENDNISHLQQIHEMIGNNDVDSLKREIQKNPNIVNSLKTKFLNHTLLYTAVLHNKKDIVALLLEHGADVAATTKKGEYSSRLCNSSKSSQLRNY